MRKVLDENERDYPPLGARPHLKQINNRFQVSCCFCRLNTATPLAHTNQSIKMIDAGCQTDISFSEHCKDDITVDEQIQCAVTALSTHLNSIKARTELARGNTNMVIRSDRDTLMQHFPPVRQEDVEQPRQHDYLRPPCAGRVGCVQTDFSFSFLPRADAPVPLPYLGMMALQHLWCIARNVERNPPPRKSIKKQTMGRRRLPVKKRGDFGLVRHPHAVR